MNLKERFLKVSRQLWSLLTKTAQAKNTQEKNDPSLDFFRQVKQPTYENLSQCNKSTQIKTQRSKQPNPQNAFKKKKNVLSNAIQQLPLQPEQQKLFQYVARVQFTNINQVSKFFLIPMRLTGLQLKHWVYDKMCQELQTSRMVLFCDDKKVQNEHIPFIAEEEHIYKLVQKKVPLQQISRIFVDNIVDEISEQSLTVSMPCKHRIGRQSMKDAIAFQLQKGASKIVCPHKGQNGVQCSYQPCLDLIRRITIMTHSEYEQLKESLTINLIRDSYTSCPVCKEAVYRPETLKSNRVRCPNRQCKDQYYCLLCKCPWISNKTDVCGNQQCLLRNDYLVKAPNDVKFVLKKDDIRSEYFLPRFRACPNCKTVSEHNGGCKHFVCPKCQKDFCWVCLKLKDKNKWPCGSFNNFCGQQAPLQNFQDK